MGPTAVATLAGTGTHTLPQKTSLLGSMWGYPAMCTDRSTGTATPFTATCGASLSRAAGTEYDNRSAAYACGDGSALLRRPSTATAAGTSNVCAPPSIGTTVFGAYVVDSTMVGKGAHCDASPRAIDSLRVSNGANCSDAGTVTPTLVVSAGVSPARYSRVTFAADAPVSSVDERPTVAGVGSSELTTRWVVHVAMSSKATTCTLVLLVLAARYRPSTPAQKR
mmetsp:Transcript_10608/g.27277  ORF Transcript_10608/g.27277 Transcript_10608/m.27277 type:complete len:223 (-) Transcript_10608:519-1187(-)